MKLSDIIIELNELDKFLEQKEHIIKQLKSIQESLIRMKPMIEGKENPYSYGEDWLNYHFDYVYRNCNDLMKIFDKLKAKEENNDC